MLARLLPLPWLVPRSHCCCRGLSCRCLQLLLSQVLLHFAVVLYQGHHIRIPCCLRHLRRRAAVAVWQLRCPRLTQGPHAGQLRMPAGKVQSCSVEQRAAGSLHASDPLRNVRSAVGV
jgi:hypothetical protein